MDNVTHKISQNIRKKAQDILRLERAIRTSLPLDCHEHFNVSGIRDGQLVILSDSPVWQTRLRMYSHNMLEALEQHTGIKLHRVKIRLSSPKRVIEEPPPPRRILSQNSANILQQTARSVSDDALQAALLRLSEKAKKP